MSQQEKLKFNQADFYVPKNHLFNKLTLSAPIFGMFSLLMAFYLSKSHLVDFIYSFHVNWLFYISLCFGAVFFILIQYATKAGWSIAVRRLAENVAMTMPLFVLLFLVIVFGSHQLFHHWTSTDSYFDPVLAQKRWYLNLPFLYGRSFFYFLIFTFAAYFYRKNSIQQDKKSNFEITYTLQSRSYPFLIILGFCITFFAFDFIMSLNPHWYSTIFGLYFFASCYVSFVALLSILTRMAGSISSLNKVIGVEHYHDLGKLIFGHSCFWAYAAYAQYLLIWYGNIPEETQWYALRQSHNWAWVWVLLCVGHFLIPFVFLMARRAKRSKNMVTVVAIWMLIMHFVDLYWLIIPNHSVDGPNFSFVDFFCFVGIGGLFLGLFAVLTTKHAVIPINDPRLPESIHYENV